MAIERSKHKSTSAENPRWWGERCIKKGVLAIILGGSALLGAGCSSDPGELQDLVITISTADKNGLGGDILNVECQEGNSVNPSVARSVRRGTTDICTVTVANLDGSKITEINPNLINAHVDKRGEEPDFTNNAITSVSVSSRCPGTLSDSLGRNYKSPLVGVIVSDESDNNREVTIHIDARCEFTGHGDWTGPGPGTPKVHDPHYEGK